MTESDDNEALLERMRRDLARATQAADAEPAAGTGSDGADDELFAERTDFPVGVYPDRQGGWTTTPPPDPDIDALPDGPADAADTDGGPRP